MGRLFWKFFAFIWLAQLCGVVAIAMTFYLSGGHFALPTSDIDSGPAAGVHVSAAGSILQFSGADAFKDWTAHPSPETVFAVDDDGRELLGRPVSALLVSHARELHADHPDSQQVAEVVAPDHRRFLLFAESRNRFDGRRPYAGLGPSPSPGFGPGPEPPPGPDLGAPPNEAAQRQDLPPRNFQLGGLLGRRLPGFPPVGPTLATFFSSMLTAALLAWYMAKPIRSLRSAFTSAAAGDLGMRVAPLIGSRQDELADLGQDFDRMAERLQAAMEAQRRLLHDVSHEVRSPLARLQAAVGLLRRKSAGPDPALERIEDEIVRIDRLVGDLLRLSRLEAGETGEAEQDIDMHELVAEIVTDANFEAHSSGRRVVWQPEVQATLRGRAEILRVAIENIVRNALKHAPGSDAIRVETEVDSKANNFVLRVLDSGPGVPEAELPALFTPFYRSADAARVDGYGLGLAIARRSVEAHGGVIRARNRDAGGLAVDIILPLKR